MTPPLAIPQTLQQAIQYQQAGQLQRAEAMYRQILQIDPNHSDAWHFLGMIAAQTGNYTVAEELISRALRLSPTAPTYYNSLGNVLRLQNKLTEAVSYYQHAITLMPNFVEAYNNLGIALGELGKLAEAEACLQHALTLNPNDAKIYSNLGHVFKQQGEFQPAIQCYQRSLDLLPDNVETLTSLGIAFHGQSQLTEAIACHRRTVALNPNYADGYNNLGVALQTQGNQTEALDCYQRAVTINPNFVEAYNNLGVAYHRQGHLTEAVAYHQKVLELNPNSAPAYANLGETLKDQGKIPQALIHYRRALELKPDFAMAHSNLLLTLHYWEEDPATLFYEHQQFEEQQAKPLRCFKLPPLNKRPPHQRLKIGYLSQDFRKHSVAYFIEPILANHDSKQVEIYCYFNNFTTPDSVTQRLQQYAQHWINCINLSDEALAETIRQDQIDILVDLMGHTGHNRLLVFARKPAPVQVTYLGYSDTTGLTTMDYRITDRYADPDGLADPFSSETLIRMPHSYFCYQPADETRQTPTKAPPVLENGHITFGSFNNYAKLSPATLSLWAQVLESLPNSKLLIKANSLIDATTQHSLQQQLTDLGVASDRLILVPHLPAMTEHLSLYHQVDIALDSFPYNGATTTCEALWMGIPVVTLVGKTHVSRMGLSILTTVGLTDLIATSPEEYVKICLRLADDIQYLQTLRKEMRDQMQSSPLMQAEPFTRQLEQLYRKISIREAKM